MIAKRIAAVAAAAALVLAALVLRDRVIEDGSDRSQPPADATVLVCASELRLVCQAAAGDSIDVETEEAGVTLDRLAALDDAGAAPIWVAFDPFPDMLAELRTRDGRPPLEPEVEPLASSPLTVVTSGDVTTELTGECRDPVDLRCVGDSELSVGFAGSPESGIGLLGLTALALDYGAGGIPFDDPLFERWVGRVARSVSRSQMSGGTAITTIQVRASSMDVAIGAEAELVGDDREGLDVLYAAPMRRIDVVVAVPPGSSTPGGLGDALRAELTSAGWSPTGATEGATPDGGAVLAVREIWRNP